MALKIEKIVQKPHNASLLIALSGLVSKILAAIYRIPYQNLVGDRGFYAYQQIYPLLAIISTLSLTSFPNILASFAQKSKKVHLENLLVIELAICYILAFVIIIFHTSLAILFGDERFSPSLLMLAGILFLTPFISFYRGMAQADQDMKPTAVSQVLEQTIRILIIIASALAYIQLKWNIYQTANVAVSGNIIASFFTLLYLKRTSSYNLREYFIIKYPQFSDVKKLGLPSLVFLFYSVYLLLFQLVDALFVKNTLIFSGLSTIEAESKKGIYDRGQPLIQFGLIITTAIFTSYLPILSQLFHKNKKVYQAKSQDLFEFIFYLTLTITVGFMCLLGPINQILFEDNSGYFPLLIYLFCIFLSSMIQFCHQKKFIELKNRSSIFYLTLGMITKLVLTPFLTYFLGILGSSLASCLALLLVLISYLMSSSIILKNLLNFKYYTILFLLAIALFVLQGYCDIENRLLLCLEVICLVGLFSIIFIFIAIKIEVFGKNLWQFVPFIKEK